MTFSSLTLRSTRALFSLACAFGAATLVSSCLTPDATFSDSEGVTDGLGGDGSVGVVDPEHCRNRTVDADETGTDCGGKDCESCAVGEACQLDRDCENGECNGAVCRNASCMDGLVNGGESDVDCGGEGCPPCGAASRCQADSDCESKVCESGRCAEASCSDRVHNGNESDTDCGGSCAPCDTGLGCVVKLDCEAPPQEDPATVHCEDGSCTLSCPTGQGDCNFEAADGCEANLNTEVEHCGSCDAVCAPDHATAGKCQGAQCLIDFDEGGCEGAWLDCNGDPADGCEVNTNNDPDHCGTCNAICSDENGVPSCAGGECEIACDGSFADCDGDTRSNGCEVDTNSSVFSCGACAPGGTCDSGTTEQSPYCVDGECGLTTCASGLGDCDGDSVCTDSLDTTSNCGACGIECNGANATVSCVDGGGGSYACALTGCVDGPSSDWEDCDGLYGNGCESNTEVDVQNCGGCALANDCTALQGNGALHISSIACSEGGCVITGCSGSYADCDGVATNGCEVDTSDDDTRCGGCGSGDLNAGSGVDCRSEWDHADGTCADSACSFAGCDANWGNCDSNLNDGCETDLRITEAHCGACENACNTDPYTDTNECFASNCTPVCTSNGDTCDGSAENGCENIDSSPSNCGSCSVNCGGDGTGVDSASCSSKVCNVTCNNGLCPSGPEGSCAAPLGTTEDCLSCGDSCSGQEICSATGCAIDGSGCETQFDGYLTNSFGASFGSSNGTNSCSGAACDGWDGFCQSSQRCSYDLNGGSYTSVNWNCQGGAPGATCDVDLAGGTWDMAGNPTCQSGAFCNVRPSGGHLDAEGTFDCQTDAECVFDCSSGSVCGGARVLGPNGTGLFDCEGGDCSGVVCTSGATCVFRMSGATGKPTCQSGSNCLCVSGTTSDCNTICGGGDHAPCGNAGGEPLVSSCSF